MSALIQGFHSAERLRKYNETEDAQAVVTRVNGESSLINDRRNNQLVTVCLPLHISITREAKERVESLYRNVVIIFSNERPYISNRDSEMLINIAHMIVNPVRL